MPCNFRSAPGIPEPQLNDKVWRYLDFLKFADLIFTGTLYFRRLDCFDDLSEGTMSLPSIARSYEQQQLFKARQANLPIQSFRDYALSTSKRFLDARATVWVNCWHQNNLESAGMWGNYMKAGEGIAICSTYGKLKAALSSHSEYFTLVMMKYVNMETTSEMTPEVGFSNLLYKREGFEYERELRIVHPLQSGTPNQEIGKYFQFSLEELIDQVVLAPGANPLLEKVVRLATERSLPNLKVLPSEMDLGPVRDAGDARLEAMAKFFEDKEKQLARRS